MTCKRPIRRRPFHPESRRHLGKDSPQVIEAREEVLTELYRLLLYSRSCSNTIHTARRRTSAEYQFYLLILQSTQDLEPLEIPVRFSFYLAANLGFTTLIVNSLYCPYRLTRFCTYGLISSTDITPLARFGTISSGKSRL